MASFDIVSKIDHQSLDNAVNTAKKEISTRYDFNGTDTSLELDKKALVLHITTDNEMRVETIEDILIKRMVKQNIDPKCLDFSAESYQSGKVLKKDITVKEGLDKETAKKITKMIKDQGLKVQPSIQDDQVRVSGKKIDDLQSVIAFLKAKGTDIGVPLQFVNMKS
ncbi:hypothetical protein SAMN05421823_108244 [Catalinimonas alkaloidigena]|uniref:Nucleotide-binding protein SAMN05421823_108244 n=1 Tax=Catalinimonas alkaloidigena TaxID=1075417 RepID=A0A1G9NBS2_9BACT|nr:YajQ family cyclic di-GMP-binding protein [Catalinimonas alkaloidigena]SDL83986.1 hypothetical protein SAMN05421823_108244 [Catalinimonas alkaloidigena]